jgi:hypothetical protein
MTFPSREITVYRLKDKYVLSENGTRRPFENATALILGIGAVAPPLAAVLITRTFDSLKTVDLLPTQIQKREEPTCGAEYRSMELVKRWLDGVPSSASSVASA